MGRTPLWGCVSSPHKKRIFPPHRGGGGDFFFCENFFFGEKRRDNSHNSKFFFRKFFCGGAPPPPQFCGRGPPLFKDPPPPPQQGGVKIFFSPGAGGDLDISVFSRGHKGTTGGGLGAPPPTKIFSPGNPGVFGPAGEKRGKDFSPTKNSTPSLSFFWGKPSSRGPLVKPGDCPGFGGPPRFPGGKVLRFWTRVGPDMELAAVAGVSVEPAEGFAVGVRDRQNQIEARERAGFVPGTSAAPGCGRAPARAPLVACRRGAARSPIRRCA